MSRWTGFDIVRLKEPLAPRTWLQIGGPAEAFAEPRDAEELAGLVRRCRDEQLPVRLLGGGSNVLIREEGVPGLVVQLAAPAFSRIEVQGRSITAGSGAKLGHALSVSVREGLAGLETLVGIPGTIGGALHNNAGGRGGDIGQWTCRAAVMTRQGEIVERQREELVFAYRQSSLDELAILSAQFQLEPDNPDELTKRMQKQWIVKKADQPLGHQNCGIMFRNPRGMSAGMLIEQAGLKGTRVGSVEISPRHANFVVADAGANSQDVLRLMELVRSRVLDRMGMELENAIEIW